MRILKFHIMSLFCKHQTIFNYRQMHTCIDCGVELPEEFHTVASTQLAE